jgi:CRP-like cAMP-binding protein
MQLQQFDGLSLTEIKKLLLYIPLFRQIQQDQLDLLLASSTARMLQPHTRLLATGEQNHYCYFLLRGELSVSARQHNASIQLGRIGAGEIFGELSLLLDQPRCADIRVSDGARYAIVLETDFRIFSTDDGFSLLDTVSKRIFYQNIVHHLRFKLDNLRQQYPKHPLADQHRQISPRLLAPNPAEQLRATRGQAVAMAKLLAQWNPSLQQLDSSSAGQ